MIHFQSGNLFESKAQALVNPINCVGVMGKGLALQFKSAFPNNFKVYAAACKRSEVQPGRMLVVETQLRGATELIINFPTKRHWRDASLLGDIESGLVDLVRVIRARSIASIAIPALGAGLGGLAWLDVRALIEAAMAELPEVDVQVFEPA
jgi:O-acetyl-ADP-ribose deacetylase (regulator of RNase III)